MIFFVTLLITAHAQAKYGVDDAFDWLVHLVSPAQETSPDGESADANKATESTELPDGELSGNQLGNDFFGVSANSEAEEQRRMHQKFSVDKQKINLAIENTKKLIEQSQERAYLPELYLRLSELYIEKSRIVYFLRKTEPDAVKGEKLSSLEANTLKIQAIEVYKRILSHYPNYSHLDKVHFFMAHEFRELNRIEDMVAQYQALIERFQDSEYVPESLLLLGDYYMNDGQLDLAKRQYEAVLKHPNSSAVAIARYKLAWVHINKKEFGPAIRLLEQSVSGASAGKQLDVDTYNRVDIRLEALNDMAFSYSEFYKKEPPRHAVDYFRQYAWSRPAYTVVLEKLAYRFLIKKKWQHAAYLYRELSNLQHDPEKLLEYAENIFICVNESKDYEHADQDVRIIVSALQKQRYTVHVADDDRQELMTRYELYARDVSTRLHDTSRKTGAQGDFLTAVAAYKAYLDFFDESPVYDEMKANYAESLFAAKQYAEAGKIYEQVASNISAETQAAEKETRLYSATVSYYEALKHRDQLNYFQVTQARSGLQDTGTLFATLYPQSKYVSNVMFNVAWIKHDEGKYRESIDGFKEFIKHYPRGKEADFAVQLIADAYHTLEDYEGLSVFGAEVLANADLGQTIKTEIAQIVKAAESKIISGLIISSVEDWGAGKDQMKQYAETHHASALGEQALHALFVASQENKDLAAIQTTGFDFVTQYSQSKHSESMLKVMIETALKSGQYRTLVRNLEQFVTLFPQHDTAMDFLYQAGQLRESLGQPDLANAHYNRLLAQFRITHAMKQDLVRALARNEQKLNNPHAAIKVLVEQRDSFDDIGRIEVDATIANLYRRNGEHQKARQYQKRVFANYKAKKRYPDAVNEAVAEVAYSTAQLLTDRYFATQLKGEIDNAIVSSKTSQLEKLQKAYLSVMDYQSPRWSLMACYRLYEGLMEYAAFLKNAPMPELTDEEAQQYRALIQQKAQEYVTEANQYLQTGNGLAQKLKSLEPALMRYSTARDDTIARDDAAHKDETQPNLAPFSGEITRVVIEAAAFEDAALKSLHEQLMKTPQDIALQLAMAIAYQQKKDYSQSLVMIRNLLAREAELDAHDQARLYTLLGTTYLHLGDDQLARDAFNKALESRPDNHDAALNLAGLYQHYGLVDEANQLYDAMMSVSPNDLETEFLHPRAKALFHARLAPVSQASSAM
jgi:tetratricopeptide (TPR) repeat protein